MAIAFSRIYPACQTDENEIKPGRNLNSADKHAAKPSRGEFWGIKESLYSMFELLIQECVKNIQSPWKNCHFSLHR